MSNLHILIVEDESLIALELSQSIERFSYDVVGYATNPSMAQAYMKEKKINLILMDINLNTHTTGIELYKSFNTSIPLIYITAYKDEETILSAILTNPLGYLIKPHKEDELKALLHLAKYKISNKETFTPLPTLQTLGRNYFFNIKQEKLYFGEIQINLGNKELQLLQLLICAKGAIVSFETIESVLWKQNPPSSSSMRTLIYRLRGKLEYTLIETVVGCGVKLNQLSTPTATSNT